MNEQTIKKSKFSNALSLYFEEFKSNQLTIKQKLRTEYENLVGETDIHPIKVYNFQYNENLKQK